MLSHPVNGLQNMLFKSMNTIPTLSSPPKLANNGDKLILPKDSGLSPKEGLDCHLGADVPQHLFINPANQVGLQPGHWINVLISVGAAAESSSTRRSA